MPRGGKREGAGRKPSDTTPKQRITITLSTDLVQWMDGRSVNRSEFIETLIKELAMTTKRPSNAPPPEQWPKPADHRTWTPEERLESQKEDRDDRKRNG